ncbi:hypothetical protein HDZ31DRAFT_42137 [Schizophyllum fasciatum]
MVKTRASTARASRDQPSQPSRQQPERAIARQRAAKQQVVGAAKQRAARQRSSRNHASSANAPAYTVPSLVPNKEALNRAAEHQAATMNGTLAEGQEPARYSSLYQYLPAYLGIKPGEAMTQAQVTTSLDGESHYSLYSEEYMREKLISEYGNLEDGIRDVKAAYQNAEIVGGHPDPQDPTVEHIEFEFPGLKFHVRYWLGHQTTMVSMDFCDSVTHRPIKKHKDFTLFQVMNPPFGGYAQLQSLAYCFNVDHQNSATTFIVMEGTWIEFRYRGKVVKKVQMPIRPQSAQPAFGGVPIQDVSSMSM